MTGPQLDWLSQLNCGFVFPLRFYIFPCWCFSSGIPGLMLVQSSSFCPAGFLPAHSQQFKLSRIRAGPWILVTQIGKSLGCVSEEERYSTYCQEGGLQQPFDFEVAKFWRLLSINSFYFGDLLPVLIDKKYLTLIRVVHLFVQCLSRAFWVRMFWIRQAGTSSQDIKTGCFCENWH